MTHLRCFDMLCLGPACRMLCTRSTVMYLSKRSSSTCAARSVSMRFTTCSVHCYSQSHRLQNLCTEWSTPGWMGCSPSTELSKAGAVHAHVASQICMTLESCSLQQEEIKSFTFEELDGPVQLANLTYRHAYIRTCIHTYHTDIYTYIHIWNICMCIYGAALTSPPPPPQSFRV